MEEMDLQKLSFFTEGNTFTGSRTKDPETGLMLRYLVHPKFDKENKENSKLLAYSWREDVCFERAQDRHEADFPMDEEGLAAVQEWLRKEFEAL